MTYNEFVSRLALRYGIAVVGCSDIIGYPLKTIWPNNVVTAPIEKGKYRATAFYRNSVEQQTTLAPAGMRRFTTTGTFYFTLLAPADDLQGNANLGLMAEAVANAFRGIAEPNGVWYRDITISALPPTTEWHSLRVGGKYSFDRIG